MSESINESLLIKEYEFLRNEIVSSVNEINLLGRYAIIFWGAILALLYAKGPNQAALSTALRSLMSWLPFLLTVLLTLRSYFLGKRIDILGKYIKEIETLLFTDKSKYPEGWEHFLERTLTTHPIKIFYFIKIERSWLQAATFIFYAFLVACSLIFAFLVTK